jgi:nucleoside-diphosphate-sugar epimerase
MRFFEHEHYLEDVRLVADQLLPWEKLQDRSVLISGGTGLIGSFLVDVLMKRNMNHMMGCRIYILGRDEKKAKRRFDHYWHDGRFHFIAHDINRPLITEESEKIDYVIHLASNTHPVKYASDPIGTIADNITGLQNMLEFASQHQAVRVAFASSNEVYGENRGDTQLFDEGYCGYIDPNTLRAGYPESKRCGEALCQAYIHQKHLDVVIPRFTRSYGPTMLRDDTKAISQFIRNAVDGKDIVLKSQGYQHYSYTYVADAVSGFLWILLCGKNGEAYNIADSASDIMLKDLAAIAAESTGKKVVFEIPDVAEAKGYSTATKARLDGGKLRKLGWKARYDIKTGVQRTIDILKCENRNGQVLYGTKL